MVRTTAVLVSQGSDWSVLWDRWVLQVSTTGQGSGCSLRGDVEGEVFFFLEQVLNVVNEKRNRAAFWGTVSKTVTLNTLLLMKWLSTFRNYKDLPVLGILLLTSDNFVAY